MTLVTTSHDLQVFCERFENVPFVTVDTEFVRETTFWPKPGLIQLASLEEVIAIDVLSPHLDLTPFFSLMKKESVTKVFHAARQDIEIIWNLGKIIPSPLFDTQIAAMVCGFGDQVSYSELVQVFCHINLDKSSRYTNWIQRPLSSHQLDYALADVTWLRQIYLHLIEKIKKMGRLSWLEDEFKALLSLDLYQQVPEKAWERYRHRVRKPRELAILMELVGWREREAQTRDVPRARILKDDILWEIVKAAPPTLEALMGLRSVALNAESKVSSTAIMQALQRGYERKLEDIPFLEEDRRRRHIPGANLELLKVLLKRVSEEFEVASKLIATSNDLELLCLQGAQANIPALQGWRWTIFGQKALELQQGGLGLGLDKGKIKLFSIPPKKDG